MKPKCILVDIDGTIADISHRAHHVHKTPKDWESFNGSMEADSPKHHIIDIVRAVALYAQVVVVTGRFESHRTKTLDWMIKYEVPYKILFMRQDGDYRSDHVIKREILHSTILPFWDVVGVFDDRDSVVKMWREEGLTCLQVQEGDY